MLSKKDRSLFHTSQLCSILIVLLLGLFFRFANLEKKVFWVDEVATAIRVSGYTIPEVIEDLSVKNLINRQDLLEYQVINQERDLRDTWQALTKSPEHAPLYFLLMRFWLQVWGNSIVAMRSLSVCFSLLIFPCLYWLYRELFDRPLVAWLGVMLMSVSPFYVAYAQEARPYSLWTVTIFLMGASFLRAIKLNSRGSWTLYFISLVLGFYTSLLSLFVACFQGVYLLLVRLKNKQQLIINYFITSAIALLLFSPWLLIIFTSIKTLQDNTVWMENNLSFIDLIAIWIGTILLIFGDLPLAPEANAVHVAIAVIGLLVTAIGAFILLRWCHKLSNKLQSIIRFLIISFLTILVIVAFWLRDLIELDLVTVVGAIVAVIILALTNYSLSFIMRRSQTYQWLFVILLMLSLPVSLLALDIISQRHGSGAPRYLIPTQLAIQMSVAYTLGSKLNDVTISSFKPQRFWLVLTVLFLTLGVFSCTRNLNLSPIYLKNRNVHNAEIAKIINSNFQPLVLIEAAEAVDILSLSYSVLPQVKFKLINNSDFSIDYRRIYSDVFILKPSLELQKQLSKDINIDFKQVYKPNLLAPGEISLDLWSIEQNKHSYPQ